METLAPPNSAGFTAEQKEYLLGFLAGAMQSNARPFVGLTPNGLLTDDPGSGVTNHAGPAEEIWLGTPVSELSREELWKHEQNPLDIWYKLIAPAEENRSPAPEDLFRSKFHRSFFVSPGHHQII